MNTHVQSHLVIRVRAQTLPDTALLARYRPTAQNPAFYVDCFETGVGYAVSLGDFVTAFYTTPLFRAERVILRFLAKRPSSDGDVEALAAGRARDFAAWSVEDRATDQLLMCDMRGRTRSWFMVRSEGAERTALYFGSAVVPRPHPSGTDPQTGVGLRMLLVFHKLYSRALLSAAARRLSRVAAS